MLTTNYSNIRNHLKYYCDKFCDFQETVLITRNNDKNIVMVSLEKYNELEKVARSCEYWAKIDRGIEQFQNGNGQEHNLIEGD